MLGTMSRGVFCGVAGAVADVVEVFRVGTWLATTVVV